MGVFWASYINAPEDKSIYFLRGGSSLGAPQWVQFCSQVHGRDSTVLPFGDKTDLKLGEDPRSLFRNLSPLRYAEPFFYGRFPVANLMQLLRTLRRRALAVMVPSDGGAHLACALTSLPPRIVGAREVRPDNNHSVLWRTSGSALQLLRYGLRWARILYSGAAFFVALLAAETWTDTGPTFVAGTLGNSGQNLYVNRRGELETIRRYDLDGNGHLDLLFNSTHDTYHALPATLVAAGPGAFFGSVRPGSAT